MIEHIKLQPFVRFGIWDADRGFWEYGPPAGLVQNHTDFSAAKEFIEGS